MSETHRNVQCSAGLGRGRGRCLNAATTVYVYEQQRRFGPREYRTARCDEHPLKSGRVVRRFTDAPDDRPIYTKRDVEAMIELALAARAQFEKAQRPDYSIVHVITTPDAPERPAL